MSTNKMDYSYMGNYPPAMKEYIIKAIEIYDFLYDKSLKAKNGHFFKETLTPNDVRVISLYIAALMNVVDIKAILKDSKITIREIERFLNIKIELNKDLTAAEYRNYYELFKPLLTSLLEFSKPPVTCEELFDNLHYPSRSNSRIIISFYNFLNKDPAEDISRYLLSSLKKRKELAIVTTNNKAEKPQSNQEVNSQKNDKKKENLTKYGVSLTDYKYTSNPAIGREKEISKLMVALLTAKISPLLIGNPGVGKTAIVEGLAYLIQTGKVPAYFKNKKIISLSMSSLLAGTIYRGEFEDRIDKIIKEAMEDDEVILYIDEFHSVIGAGTTSTSNLDFANILKPYLSRGRIKIIGATTKNEYEKYLSLDKAFEERFAKIEVKEPSKEELKKILLATITKYTFETGISFLEDSYLSNLVVDLLIEVTTKPCYLVNNKVRNPRLIITILDYIFAFAKLNFHEKVTLEDIKAAIGAFDILSLNQQEYVLNYLNNYQDNNEKPRDDKIITFPSRFNEN